MNGALFKHVFTFLSNYKKQINIFAISTIVIFSILFLMLIISAFKNDNDKLNKNDNNQFYKKLTEGGDLKIYFIESFSKIFCAISLSALWSYRKLLKIGSL